MTKVMLLKASPEDLNQMRSWLADLAWQDMEPEDFSEVPDDAIVRAVERHYHGGVAGFLRDGARA